MVLYLHSSGVAASCREPIYEDLLKQYANITTQTNTQESHYMAEPWRSTASDANIGRGGDFYNVGRPQPTSLCPWNDVRTYNSRRFPKIFKEARMYGGGTKYCTSAAGETLINCRCEPLGYYTRILKRLECRQSGGLYRYTPSWQLLTVGYIPVRI